MLHIVTTIRTKPRPISPKRQGTAKTRAPRGDGGVIQLPSGVWQARIRRYGRDQKRTAATQTEALALLETMRRNKPATTDALARMKMADWMERYRNEQAHTLRLKTRVNQIENAARCTKIIGRIPLNAVTPSDLRDLQAKLIEQGYAPSVQRQAWQFVAASLRRAFEDDILSSNPAAKVRPPRGAKTLRDRVTWSADQARSALESAQGSPMYLLLCCFLSTRVRPNELLGLMWGDLQDGKMFIRRTLVKAGKNPVHNPPKTPSGARDFYLAPDILGLLEQHRSRLSKQALSHDFVFTGRTGTPFMLSNFRAKLVKLCKKAGVPRLSAHELRHTATTLAALTGVNRYHLSRQTGHAGQNITDLYDHSFLDETERHKLAIPLETLLKNHIPYTSLTATQSSQKVPNIEAQDTAKLCCLSCSRR